jgi:hypothetical protein
MIVQSNWRPRLMAAMVATGVAIAGVVQAAGFDEKLKAPVMRDAGELRSQAQLVASRLDQYKSADPQQLIGDADLVRDQLDLVWKLQRAINTHQPLNDVDGVGLAVNPDGSVEVDVNAHPQWFRFDERLTQLVPHWDMEIVGPELLARGFRSGDLDILESYVKTHDVGTAGAQRVLPVALAFSKLVIKFDRLKRPVDEALVLSYVYQQARERSEASRQWAAGLFAALDAQRRRVLFSYVAEMKTKSIWTADDPSAVADTLAVVRRPNFAEGATSQAKGVAK